MDQEINDRLSHIENTLVDTNKMVSRLYRAQKRATYLRAFYWLVVIVLGFASFYLVQPYIRQLGAAYGIGSGSATDTSTPSNTSTLDTVSNLVKQYQASQKTTQ